MTLNSKAGIALRLAHQAHQADLRLAHQEDLRETQSQVLAVEEAKRPRVIRGYDGDKEVEITAYPARWPRAQIQVHAAMGCANGLLKTVEEEDGG